MSLDQWDTQTEVVTTEELDEAVNAMSDFKGEYEAKKKISNDAHHQYEESRARVISLLAKANKTKYEVDGVGKVSVSQQLKVKFPSDHDQRASFFKWLNESYGGDGFLTYASVNYNALNSLYNQEFERAKDEGTADDFTVPGIASPEHEPKLSFRR